MTYVMKYRHIRSRYKSQGWKCIWFFNEISHPKCPERTPVQHIW